LRMKSARERGRAVMSGGRVRENGSRRVRANGWPSGRRRLVTP
jgi:hypothetical protein